jgi:hypothetical protein
MRWYSTPPNGRAFALCYYANDPNYKNYYVGQWDPNYGRWITDTVLTQDKTDQILWTYLPEPPDKRSLDPAIWMIKFSTKILVRETTELIRDIRSFFKHNIQRGISAGYSKEELLDKCTTVENGLKELS